MFTKILDSKVTQSAVALFTLYVLLCSTVVPFPIVSAAFPATSTSIANEDTSQWVENGAATNAQQPVLTEKMKNALGDIPLSFEINRGQVDKRVKFLSRGNGYSLFLTQNESVLSLRKPTPEKSDDEKIVTSKQAKKQTAATQTSLRMKLVGGNKNAQIEGLEPLAAKTNYFTGKDQKNWRTNVSQYAKVRYSQVYPGIDAIYYGKGQELEYDFVVAPGADPRKIKMQFKGADKIKVDDNGDLVLSTKLGDVRHRKPFIYQELDGERQQINGRYSMLSRKRVGFEIEGFDQRKPLVIDPVIAYSTLLGGNAWSGVSSANGIATHMDTDGKVYVYVVGTTSQPDFPTKNALYPTYSGGANWAHDGDAYIAKFDMSVSGEGSLIYSTFLGGSGDEIGAGIAVDSNGNAYIVGKTISTNFPILEAVQTVLEGTKWWHGDAFIAALSSDGSSLIYSTYLGGSSDEQATAIAVDSLGNAFIKGNTLSIDFPTVNAYQSATSGNYGTYFVSKIAPPSGQMPASLVYSTYLGIGDKFLNGHGDWGNGIAVDSMGYIHVTGETASNNFPTLNGFQTQLDCPFPSGNAFVTKLNPLVSGEASLLYSTYLGGSCGSVKGDAGRGIAVDSAGNTYVTGVTTSNDFPTTDGAFMRNRKTSQTGFVSKIDTTKSGTASLIYSTLIGGFGGDSGTSIAVDADGNTYVTGETYSYDFPRVNAPQPSHGTSVSQSIDKGINWNVISNNLVVPYVNSIVIDTHTSPRTLYVGAGIHHGVITAQGGVFKSGDGGLSWSPLNHGLTSLDVWSLVISPVNPSTIYAATGDGIFRTTDGGSNWGSLNNGLDDQAMASVNTLLADTITVNGITSVTIYAGTDSGLYRMVEGESVWSLTGHTDPVGSIAIDPQTSPHTLFVTKDGVGVFQSSDDGVSWEDISNGFTPTMLAVDTSTTPSTLFALNPGIDFHSHGLNKKLPGSLEWEAVETGGLASLTPTPTSFLFDYKTSPATLYIGDFHYGLIMSGDGGNTWKRIFSRGLSSLALDVASNAVHTPLYAGIYFHGNNPEAFVSKLDPTGSSLLFSTTIGGYGWDSGRGIALDSSNNIYVAGKTGQERFPTVNAFQAENEGGGDAFVLKLGDASLPTASTETVSTELAVQTGTLEVALPNIQDTNTDDNIAPTISVEPIDSETTANLTVSNNLGAYEIKVNNATVDTTGYFNTGCTTDGIAIPCWEKHGIRIAFSVLTVNDEAVFNNLVISHGEDTDNNPDTPLVLVPYDLPYGNARHTYKDFANRKIWVYVPSLSPFFILKGASDQISDLIRLTSSFNLNQGIQNSLKAKLENAKKALLAAKSGYKATACNIMNAFISEVQAQTGKSITHAQAQQLLLSAKQIRAVLGCS